MSISLQLTPGKQFAQGEQLTQAKLNLLGTPTVNLVGGISTTSIADGAVTTAKLANLAVTGGKIAAATVTLSNLDPTAVGGPIIGNSRNLKASQDSGTPNTKVDISADAVVLQNASAGYYLALNVNSVVDFGTSGAVNGLDTGAAAASTWYYLWVISDGTNIGGLLSLSSSAPTMPGAYVFKALVGAVRMDGSTHIVPFYQLQRTIYLRQTVATTGSTGGEQTLSLATLVPPTAKQAFGNAGSNSNGNALIVRVSSDSNLLAACYCGGSSGQSMTDGSITWGGSVGFWKVPLVTAQQINYKTPTGVSYAQISVSGYEI